MYCANCGTQLMQGLSYCNRCGFNLKERTEVENKPVKAFLAAITLLGIVGLGIMIGGSLTLSRDAHLSQDIVAMFMLFTFLMVSVIEFMLVRNLSRLLSTPKENQSRPLMQPPAHQDLRLPQTTNIGEPIPSVTENTTRTLEYARREQ